jgi:predicted amidohydrolase
MRFCLIPLKTVNRAYSENYAHLKERLAEIIPQYHPNIICAPECTFTGYLYKEEDFVQFAEAVPGRTIEMMSELATIHKVYLCFGLLEKHDRDVYNTAVLLSPTGEILLKHRKNNEKPPFINGEDVGSVDTQLGKVGILICGDLFSDEVRKKLDPALDFLIVPMSRAFDGISPDSERWEKEERGAYIEAAKATGRITMIVNALEIGIEEPSFGGALIIDSSGRLAAESSHGTDNVLIWDFQTTVGG